MSERNERKGQGRLRLRVARSIDYINTQLALSSLVQARCARPIKDFLSSGKIEETRSAKGASILVLCFY